MMGVGDRGKTAGGGGRNAPIKNITEILEEQREKGNKRGRKRRGEAAF